MAVNLSNSNTTNSNWNIEEELGQQGIPLKEWEALDEAQELSFRKNYKILAHKIAETFANGCLSGLRKELKKLKELKERDQNVLRVECICARQFTMRFPLGQEKPYFLSLAKETVNLSPFSEWINGKFYLNSKMIIEDKIQQIFKEVSKKVEEHFTSFKNAPGNQLFQYSPAVIGEDTFTISFGVYKTPPTKEKSD